MDAAFNVLRGTRCLVTGGAGFIGSHIATHLVRGGASVRVLDNLSTGFARNLQAVADDLEFIEGDAADADLVDRCSEGVDYVFHQAAMASVPRSMREPALCHAWCATSTVNVLQAAASSGVRRVVLASTSAAYGNSSFVSKRESDPPAPLSPYAAAKLSAEQYCGAFYRGFGLETAVLRYFNVFGPRQDPQSEYSAVIPRFVSMILSGQRPVIYGDGGQSRDFVYVADVVQANLLAATVPAAAGGTFNVARGGSTTLLELLNDLREILGESIEPIHEPAREGDVRDSLADISQARTVLGYDPQVTVEAGLRQSVDYYRSIANQKVGSR
ncbi:SDR family oxidoreductase [Candidatus Laterigemmans baculatus]|uniref:SDR family oxidoreductase n=1 Tax=Candidatus Laterigemmans baculatus TaxID=2770505 RepID=UPI0013DA5B9F|nr:SDR family oxidoreductase [Candidatus Laterigemmans baculatus]